MPAQFTTGTTNRLADGPGAPAIERATLSRALIGRDRELAFLLDRQRESARSKGSVVMVTGPAGIGKSRLLREFRIAAGARRVRIVESPCLEHAQQPFAPILDVLTTLDPAAVTAARTARNAREQFEMLRDAFFRAAARGAVVAIVEDAHWADAATLELLAHLAPRTENARLLVIVSSREPRLERSPNVHRIALAPLDLEDSEGLIHEALGGRTLAPALRRGVAATADGNPFYIEELLKTTLERGRVGVPQSLAAAVLERFNALPATVRAIVERAAVLGMAFDVHLLTTIAGVPRNDVLDGLLLACDRQIVEEIGPDRFGFRHALTREALYAHMGSRHVAALHRRTLRALEGAGEGAPAEESAYHAWNARDFESAARYAEAAGEGAAQLFAYDDAAFQYERALEALGALARDTAVERARVMERLARCRFALSDHAGARDAYARAAALLARTDHRERAAEMAIAAVYQAYCDGDRDEPVQLEAMLRVCAPGERAARARLHVGLANLYSLRYDFSRVADHLALVDDEVVATRPALRDVLENTRCALAFARGDVEAYDVAFQAWREAALAHDDASALLAHYKGGLFFAIFGMHDRARAVFHDGLVLARERRDVMAEGATLAMSAFAHLATGDLAAVGDAVRAARRLPMSKLAALHVASWGTVAALHLGDEALLAECMNVDGIELYAQTVYAPGFAEALARRGRAAEARSLLAAAIRKIENPRGLHLTMLAVARLGDERDFPLARAILAKAAVATRTVVEQPSLALFDAYAARRAGSVDRVRELAASAAEGYVALGYPLLHAEALEVAGRNDEARAVYERHGAAGDVARLAAPGASALSSPALSEREAEVARAVAAGLTNREVALRFAISAKTVEKHIASAFRKLGVSSRAQLAVRVTDGSG